MSKQNVMMIWPEVKGGMLAVTSLLNKSSLINEQVINLITYKEGNIASRILSYFKFLINFISILLSNKDIQLIHIHSASKGSFARKTIALFIAKFFNKKILLQIHDGRIIAHYNKSPYIVKKIMSGVLNNSDMIIALSEQARSDLKKICTNKHIKILHNPIILTDKPANSVCDSTKPFNVIYLGYICKEKGCYDIIKAAELINDKRIKISLYGNYEVEEIRESINKNDLKDRLFVKSWIGEKEKEDVLKNADILILPSYYEGLPITVLEAMANKLPVIATNVGGIPEAVEDGVSGFLITPGNYKDLADRIEFLSNNPDLRQKMGEQGYKIAQEKFNLSVIAQKLNNLYKELIDVRNYRNI